MQRVLKSSQDFFVARPRYFDAKGFLYDLDVIARVGGTSSPIKQLNMLMGDFIASVIDISDLSGEKQKEQLQNTKLPFRATKHSHSHTAPNENSFPFLTLCFLICEKKAPNYLPPIK